MASKNSKNALSYGVDIFTYDYLFRLARVHAFDRRTDGRTDGQMSIARCDLTKLDAYNEVRCAQKWI